MKTNKRAMLVILLILFVGFGSSHLIAELNSNTIASVVVPRDRDNRYVENVSISVTGSSLTLSWSDVPGAISYKVYSSSYPDTGFNEDSSGIFAATSWTTAVEEPNASTM